MKMKSVAGLVCCVKKIAKTAEFYKTLGFIVDEQTVQHLSVSLHEFWIDFEAQDKEDKPDFQKEALAAQKGSGIFIYINVEDVNVFYADILEKGLKPSSEPKDWPWGNREFVLRDPDGYKLVFFKKI